MLQQRPDGPSLTNKLNRIVECSITPVPGRVERLEDEREDPASMVSVVTSQAFNAHKRSTESYIKDHGNQLSKLKLDLEGMPSESGLETKLRAMLRDAKPSDLEGVFPVLYDKITTVSKDLGLIGDEQSLLKKAVACKIAKGDFAQHKTDVHEKLNVHSLQLSKLQADIKQKLASDEIEAIVSTQLKIATPEDLPNVVAASDKMTKAIQDELKALKNLHTQQKTDAESMKTVVDGQCQTMANIQLKHSVLESRATSLDTLVNRLDRKQRTLDKGRDDLVDLVNHEITAINKTVDKLQSRISNVEGTQSVCKIGVRSASDCSNTPTSPPCLPPSLVALVANKFLDVETRFGGAIRHLTLMMGALQTESLAHKQEVEKSSDRIRLLSEDNADLRAEAKLRAEEFLQSATAVKALQEENNTLRHSVESCRAAYQEQKIMIETLCIDIQARTNSQVQCNTNRLKEIDTQRTVRNDNPNASLATAMNDTEAQKTSLASTITQLQCNVANALKDQGDHSQELDVRHATAIAILSAGLVTAKDDAETRDTIFQADIASLKQSRQLQYQLSDRLAAEFRQIGQDVLLRLQTLEMDIREVKQTYSRIAEGRLQCPKLVEDGMQTTKAQCLHSLEKGLKAMKQTYSPSLTQALPTSTINDFNELRNLRDIDSCRLDTVEIDLCNLRRHVEALQPLPTKLDNLSAEYRKTLDQAKIDMDQKCFDRKEALKNEVEATKDRQQNVVMVLKQVSLLKAPESAIIVCPT
jgi:hypothetical protein